MARCGQEVWTCLLDGELGRRGLGSWWVDGLAEGGLGAMVEL